MAQFLEHLYRRIMETEIVDGVMKVTQSVVVGEWTQEQLQSMIATWQAQIVELQSMIAEKQNLLNQFGVNNG